MAINPLDPRFRLTPASSFATPPVPAEVPDLDAGQLAARFSENRFGLRVRPVPSSVATSTGVTTLVSADPKRLFWLVQNQGTTDVRIGVNDPTITGSVGILLAAGGGYASMDVVEDGESVSYSVFVVAVSGTPTVYVLQVVGI